MKSHHLFLIPLLAAQARIPAQSTINPTIAYAYGANTGWLNARPSLADGVSVGGAFLSGKMYAANFGWISLGNGAPANGHTYSNASGTDYGINHDGTGTLSGYAYSGNIGWINFGWAGANDPNRPHVNLLTGYFSGYAYSANTGWINLAENLSTDTLSCPDADGEGMADAWEMQHFGKLTVAETGTDCDGDGISDASEYAADTDPKDPADYLRIDSQSYDAGFTKITLQFSTTRPTRTYHIQMSTTLAPGDWFEATPMFLAEPGTSTTVKVKFPPLQRLFFRVVAQKPL